MMYRENYYQGHSNNSNNGNTPAVVSLNNNVNEMPTTSSGRNLGVGVITTGDYQIHQHGFPPPAHHHQLRADNLRAAEALHAQLLREAHNLKPNSAWGQGGIPNQYHHQDL